MRLDDVELHGIITENSPSKKITIYEYLWTNENAIEESGLGIRTLNVEGVAYNEAERDEVERICESPGVKKLYFASSFGAEDDRYYKVYTKTAQLSATGANPDVWNYTVECLCADSAVYFTATDSVVW